MVTILNSIKAAALFTVCAFATILSYPLYIAILNLTTGNLSILITMIYITIVVMLFFYLPIRELITIPKGGTDGSKSK